MAKKRKTKTKTAARKTAPRGTDWPGPKVARKTKRRKKKA
jgi:hypothetical protein